MNPKDRLIVALDVDSEEKAVRLAERLKNDIKFFKIGLELFTACGPKIVERIREMDCSVFLDLKLHDIPNTVARASSVLTRLKPFMFNVHALGGFDMMQSAVASAEETASAMGVDRPKILAVTILTSIDGKTLKKLGMGVNIKTRVLALAGMASDAGLDGVVASPFEAGAIRKKMGKDFLIVTPGVRPQGASAHDQKRIATPKGAIKAGADFIVVGRPITEARDPVEAAQEILSELETGDRIQR